MNCSFTHHALSLNTGKPLVYTAMSKHYFYFRMHITHYVLEQGKVPLNPFMLFDYFLLDSIERDLVRQANNSLVMRADELWAFGPISNGVLAEILIARKAKKRLSFFKIEKPYQMILISPEDIEMEEEVKQYKSLIFEERSEQLSSM